MLNKKYLATKSDFPGLKRPGCRPECVAQQCATEHQPTSIMATVIDSVFNKNSFTMQEQQIILMVIDEHSGKNIAARWRPEWQSIKALPAFITEAIKNDRLLEIEKLQALRKFTIEILELQHWVTEDMVNEYLAAGYSKTSILDLKALARLVVNNQQQRDKPCVLFELPCVNSTRGSQ